MTDTTRSATVERGPGADFERTSAIARALRVGSPPNNLLRFALAVLATAVTVIALVDLLAAFRPYGIDLEIPLRAADRWVNGGQPYLASSFNAPAGPDLPFLYPPVVLPFLAPLLSAPRTPLLLGWCGLCLLAAVWTCRRLRSPWWLIPGLLAWPPFSEGIVGGNVQVLLFAAYVMLFFRAGDGGADLRPIARDPSDPATPAVREGVLATLVAALKVAQLHPWAFLLFRRWRAALVGAGLALGVAAVVLPLTGTGLWLDWLAQVRRAADPSWLLAGIAIGRYVPAPLAIGVTIASIAALRWVPASRAGRWVGLLSVLGAPSLHTFGLLFMVPAMLAIRREVALIAAFFVATYTEPGFWIGIGIVAAAFAAGELRAPWLMEPSELGSRGRDVAVATPAVS